jgi:Fe-S oxidoreductase
MAGGFGYLHADISRQIAARLVAQVTPVTTVVAPGASCRHQVEELTGARAVHPAVLLARMLSP